MNRHRFQAFAAAAALVLVIGCESEEGDCPDRAGTACIWAGTGHAAFNGDGLALRESMLYWPVDVSFTDSGTYVLDWNNHRVRHVVDGTFDTVVGTDFVGDGDPTMADLAQPGAMGTDIALNHPTQLIEMPDGGLMLMAWHNHKLRRFDPESGMAYVMCGRGGGYAGDGMPASDAATRLNQPSGGAVAPDGTIYVLDQRNQRIRKIDGTTGIITTVAGGFGWMPPAMMGGMPTPPVPGYSGDGGPPIDAQFNFPTGSNPQPNGTIVLDDVGRLYLSDTLNHRVRRIDFAANVIETVAGNGTAAYSGDGGPAVAASINNPRDLAIGPDGRLYIADEGNHVIRAVDLGSGEIETVIGTGEAGSSSKDELQDGLDALETALNRPAGVAFGDDDALYVSDTLNNVIRRLPLD
jgi:sugar lactone lactonase YvrE